MREMLYRVQTSNWYHELCWSLEYKRVALWHRWYMLTDREYRNFEV